MHSHITFFFKCSVRRLCSEQLSYQTHYEYGMRAVKTVLEAVSKFRSAHPEACADPAGEAAVVRRVMLNVNLAKFVSTDEPAFVGILDALFAGVEPAQVDREDLKDAIRKK